MLIIDIFGIFEMTATKGYWFNVLIYSFLIESATHAQKTWTERRYDVLETYLCSINVLLQGLGKGEYFLLILRQGYIND